MSERDKATGWQAWGQRDLARESEGSPSDSGHETRSATSDVSPGNQSASGLTVSGRAWQRPHRRVSPYRPEWVEVRDRLRVTFDLEMGGCQCHRDTGVTGPAAQAGREGAQSVDDRVRARSKANAYAPFVVQKWTRERREYNVTVADITRAYCYVPTSAEA
jgi:hypothetical protein